jgi:hypothetical protein
LRTLPDPHSAILHTLRICNAVVAGRNPESSALLQ